MAIEKVINVRVDVSEANSNLDKLEGNLNKVSKAGEKANLSNSFNATGKAVEFLDSKTKGLASGWINVAKASRKSAKAMKSALISSGVGLLLVIVGEIVENWEKISEAIFKTKDPLKDKINTQKDIISNLEFELDLLRIQKKTLDNQGKSSKLINDQLKEKLKTLILENEAHLQSLKIADDIATAKEREYSWWQKIQLASNGLLGQAKLISEEEKKQQKIRQEEINKQTKATENLKLQLSQLNKQERLANEKAIRDQERLNELKFKQFLKEGEEAEKRRLEAEELARQEQQAESFLAAEEEDGLIAEEDKRLENQLKVYEKLREFEELDYLERIARQEQRDIEELERLNATEEEKQKVREYYKGKRITLEEQVKDAKVNIAKDTLFLAQEIAGKGSKIGKGLAVAQATISGIQGVQNAYSTAQKSPITTFFPGYPLIQAGLAGAFSAIQIKKILSTDETGQSISSANSSVGSGGASAPSFNLVQGTGTNQIADTLNNQDRPIQAYVVSGEVSTAQELDRNAVEDASI